MLERESHSELIGEDELARVESEGVDQINVHSNSEQYINDLTSNVERLGGTVEGILPREMYQRILELESVIDGGDSLPSALGNELVHLRDAEKKMLRDWIRLRKANSEQQKEAA